MSGRYITLELTVPQNTGSGRYITLPLAPIPPVPGANPAGIAPGEFGTPVITVTASFAPSGWSSSAAGTPAIYNSDQHAVASGIASAATYGTPAIYNSDQHITASGRASTVVYGTATVINWDQDTYPTGFAAGAFGTPTVFNYHQYVAAVGTAFGAFGTTDVQLYTRYVSPSGISAPAAQVGAPTEVFDPTQFITVGTGINTSNVPTTHYVADYYQYIDINGFGFTTHAVPAPFIDFRVRTITVPFIVSTFYGTPVVDNNDIRPAGWASSIVDTGVVVELGTRFLGQHSSQVFSEYGQPDVQLFVRYVGANSTNSLEFGAVQIYNLTQSLEAGPFFTNSPPGEFGTAWFRNRNVTLTANSFVSSRFGPYTSTYVTNAARQLLPSSIDSTLWGSTDISHRVRTIPLAGIDSFVSRPWHIVYNNARVIAPASIGTGGLGRPSDVRNLNRTVAQWSVGDTNVFGTAFIARAVRTVTQFNSYPHLTGYFGVPGIRFTVRPIFPPSVVPEYPLGVPRPDGLFGATTVTGPFIPTIRPNMAIPMERYGTLEIRNRNRTIRPPAVTTRDEFGPFTTVENFIRYSTPAGWISSRVGEHTVRDRTQRATPATLTIPTFPTTHQVRNLSPDPPSLQYITAGFWLPSLIVSVPFVRFPTFYPLGWDSSSFGMPAVRSNQIIVDRGIVNLDQIGVPWARGPQYLPVQGFRGDSAPVKPRVSPHTIYAPYGDRATDLARANHPTPNGMPHVIGPESISYAHIVTNRNRNLYPIGVSRTGYGVPSVILRTQYVFAVQIKSLRMGLPIILGVPQFVNLDTENDGIAPVGFGGTAVTVPLPEPQVILASGFSRTSVGSQNIQNFNREILATGIPHRGNPQEGFTNPWGVPMFGYPRTLVVTGFLDSMFSTGNRVEYAIRHLYPEGFDSCSFVEEDIVSFNERMVVSGRRLVLPLSIPSQENIPQPVVTR